MAQNGRNTQTLTFITVCPLNIHQSPSKFEPQVFRTIYGTSSTPFPPDFVRITLSIVRAFCVSYFDITVKLQNWSPFNNNNNNNNNIIIIIIIMIVYIYSYAK